MKRSLVASVQASRALRWQASDYQKPQFEHRDGKMYFNGCRVLEEMPNRTILERLKDLAQGRQYVFLPTFVPKYGPYNHMPHPHGNPPSLNMTFWHANGPQQAHVEGLSVALGVGAIVVIAYGLFKLLSGRYERAPTITKQWKEANEKRQAYIAYRQAETHKIGQPVTIYDPVMDPANERDLAKYKRDADKHTKAAALLQKVIEDRHAQLKDKA